MGSRTGFNPNFSSSDSIKFIWTQLGLPESDLAQVHLTNTGTDAGIPSTYHIGHLAQAVIALSTLAVASFQALRLHLDLPSPITVDRRRALLEFRCERFNLLNGQPPRSRDSDRSVYAVRDGYVRIHDGFPHYLTIVAKVLGVPDVDRETFAKALANWTKVEFETATVAAGACCVALRSPAEWSALPHAGFVSDFPISIQPITLSGASSKWHDSIAPERIRLRPLAGIRVVELSRVIAAPVAGKTLAAHGADVIWVTASHLPALQTADRELARGKRSVRLDLRTDADCDRLRDLIRGADVFLQSYRPGTLAARGFDPVSVARLRPDDGIVYATLSAYGDRGPWSERRGYDSLVQAASGLNVAEAEAEGLGRSDRVLPCQALDHGTGYLLAFGIVTALRRRAQEGGSHLVKVSLAQTMKWLTSLGRLPPETLYQPVIRSIEEIPAEWLETRSTGLGQATFLKHSGVIQGSEPFWERMVVPLGTHEPRWEEESS